MDLFKITKSKTREKILQLFFSDADKKYYLRELERILGVSVGNIRRELLFLEESGVFKKEKMGKQIYYSLNKKSAIFENFKEIISKTIGVEGSLQKALRKIKNIDVAFIFGSFARQKENSFSDVDVMIIGEPNEDDLISEISSLENKLNREINYSIFSAEDFNNSIRKKEVFLEEIIKKPKLFVVGNQNELEKIIKR